MKVILKQHKVNFLFRQMYSVIHNEKTIFQIHKPWYRLQPIYEMYDKNNDAKIARIESKLFKLRAEGFITTQNSKFKVDQPSIDHMKYSFHQVEGGNDVYHALANKGLSGSIYLNKVQIGQWEKNSVVIYDGDIYNIEVDDGLDPLLISCMMMMVDIHRISVTVGGNAVGWEYGNIGVKNRRKNKNWRPKLKQ